ncbi:hypothetical protein V6N12_014949 [Hibiscus sabdariffa]|uniref:Uncharacterized protein n=1 Tax=Hibiscus sabdariffa TaxID=183260 RepID=A0ABR2DM24_9ROSI
MAAYGGYTYNGSYTTTDQVANGKQKPIMSYNSKGDTNGWCWPDTKSETVVEQLCVYKYTQSSSSVKVVEASRDYGHVEGLSCKKDDIESNCCVYNIGLNGVQGEDMYPDNVENFASLPMEKCIRTKPLPKRMQEPQTNTVNATTRVN